MSANKVKQAGKVIGIDMTDEMLEKAANHAKQNGYTNVEFKKGDIEKGIPIDDNIANVVISNCDKVEEGNFCDTLLEKLGAEDGKNDNSSPFVLDAINNDLDLIKKLQTQNS